MKPLLFIFYATILSPGDWGQLTCNTLINQTPYVDSGGAGHGLVPDQCWCN